MAADTYPESRGLNPFVDAWKYLGVFRESVGSRFYLVFVLALLAALTEGLGIALALPLLGALRIDTGAHESTPQALKWFLSTLGLSDSLIGILLVIGGAFLVKAILQFAYKAYSGYLQAQLMRELTTRLFDAYGRMGYPYYAAHNTGHFVNVIGAQVNGYLASFNAFTLFMTRIIQAAAYVGVAVWLAWQFGVMAISVGLLLLLFFGKLNEYIRGISRLYSQENGQLRRLLIQAIQSFKYLASTDQMPRLRGPMVASIERVAGYRVRQRIWGAFTGVVTEPISVGFIVGIVIFQVGILGHELAPILVAILLFHKSLGMVLSVQVHWQQALNQIGSVEMVRDELEALKANEEPCGNVTVGPLREAVELRNVSFAYESDAGNVLKNVDLWVPARTTVALVGESGAGKSTIVDLVTLLLKPQHGSVYIDGIPGSDIAPSSWRSQIGYVAQDPVLFDDTIATNIAMTEVDWQNDSDLLRQVEEAARRAHIDGFIRDQAEGYFTKVGDRGIRLSGGQRQRLAIARELFKKPDLLILDEATSSLDTESERHIQQSIDGLRGAMTVVIIAHRLSTIRNVDHVYVIHQGRVVEDGPYAELRSRDDSRLRKMIEMQAV